MKSITTLFYYIFLVAFVATLSGCKEDLDYRKACEEKDWVKAYSICEKLYDKASDYGAKHGTLEPKTLDLKCQYSKALRYVVLEECLTVYEQTGEAGLVRMAVIIKEHKVPEVYDDLIEIAEGLNNESLTQKLKKLAGKEDKEENTDSLLCTTII